MHLKVIAMLAKLTSKIQLTLPKAVTVEVEVADNFDVALNSGRIVLTRVRINRVDSVREKLAELGSTESDVSDAITWARTQR